MKKILSYALFIGVAVAGGMAVRDKPKDQTQAWADYYERNRKWREAYEAQVEASKPKYASIMLDPDARFKAEAYAKYFPKRCESGGGGLVGISEDKMPSVSEIFKTPDYLKENIASRYESPVIQPSQPNLSGVYSTIPATGPNSGKVQFNYVQGPF